MKTSVGGTRVPKIFLAHSPLVIYFQCSVFLTIAQISGWFKSLLFREQRPLGLFNPQVLNFADN